jgi:hypothetical protein
MSVGEPTGLSGTHARHWSGWAAAHRKKGHEWGESEGRQAQKRGGRKGLKRRVSWWPHTNICSPKVCTFSRPLVPPLLSFPFSLWLSLISRLSPICYPWSFSRTGRLDSSSICPFPLVFLGRMNGIRTDEVVFRSFSLGAVYVGESAHGHLFGYVIWTCAWQSAFFKEKSVKNINKSLHKLRFLDRPLEINFSLARVFVSSSII